MKRSFYKQIQKHSSEYCIVFALAISNLAIIADKVGLFFVSGRTKWSLCIF